MAYLTARQIVPLRMDDPDINPGDLVESMTFLRSINQRFGVTKAVIRQFQFWSSKWKKDEIIRVLDVGAGSADIALALLQWADRSGFKLHLTCVDIQPKMAAIARELVGDQDNLNFVTTDARNLMDHFKPASFHYIHAGMFLHHLADIEILTILRIMDRLVKQGLIWNDLIRGTLPKLGVRLIARNKPEHVHHDVMAAVAQGFTKSEVMDFTKRIGLEQPQYRRYLFGRFTLTSTKKDLDI